MNLTLSLVLILITVEGTLDYASSRSLDETSSIFRGTVTATAEAGSTPERPPATNAQEMTAPPTSTPMPTNTIFLSVTWTQQPHPSIMPTGIPTTAPTRIPTEIMTSTPFHTPTQTFTLPTPPTGTMTATATAIPTETLTVTPEKTPTIYPTPQPSATFSGDSCSQPRILGCDACVMGNTWNNFNYFSCAGEGFQARDIVYEFFLSTARIITVTGEADFDADWAIASHCDQWTGDILCCDFAGAHVSPVCTDIDPSEVHEFGHVNFSAYLEPGHYYIWVDGYEFFEYGEFSLQIDCADAYPPPECPEDSTFAQRAFAGYEQNEALLSDMGVSRLIADDFSGLDGALIQVGWWGIEMTQTYEPCEHSRDFQIKFYQDSGGFPGQLTESLFVTPVTIDTGIDYDQYDLMFYSANLPEPISMTDGWIAVQAMPDPEDCLFWQACSPQGNGYSVWRMPQQWRTMDVNLSLCLKTDQQNTAVPAAGLGFSLLLLLLMSLSVGFRFRAAIQR